MILLIDNYDSFTYNLYQYLCELGAKVKVVRNDKVSISEVKKMNPTGLVLSPGPGTPKKAGICLNILKHCQGDFPILGVCLGHQSIGEAFGGKIIRAKKLMHGKISEITHNQKGVFKDLKTPLKVTRYHSLIIDPQSLPNSLEITSQTNDGIIMGVKHKQYDIEGIQFHPESFVSESGKEMLSNFYQRCRK